MPSHRQTTRTAASTRTPARQRTPASRHRPPWQAFTPLWRHLGHGRLDWSRRTRPGMVSRPRCVSAHEACADPVRVAELTTAMRQKRAFQAPTRVSIHAPICPVATEEASFKRARSRRYDRQMVAKVTT